MNGTQAYHMFQVLLLWEYRQLAVHVYVTLWTGAKLEAGLILVLVLFLINELFPLIALVLFFFSFIKCHREDIKAANEP